MAGKWQQDISVSNMQEQITYEISDFPICSRELILENYGGGGICVALAFSGRIFVR